MIFLKLNRLFYGLSRMLHLSEFVMTLRSSVVVVFNNFLLIDATDRSKISSDQKRFFIALSLYPLSFFANTPIKGGICELEGIEGELDKRRRSNLCSTKLERLFPLIAPLVLVLRTI